MIVLKCPLNTESWTYDRKSYSVVRRLVGPLPRTENCLSRGRSTGTPLRRRCHGRPSRGRGTGLNDGHPTDGPKVRV